MKDLLLGRNPLTLNGILAVVRGSLVVINWKCRCGAVDMPVFPASAMISPALTVSPSATRSEPFFQVSVETVKSVAVTYYNVIS